MSSWRATFGEGETNDQREDHSEQRIDGNAPQQDFWIRKAPAQPEFQVGSRQLLHPTYPDPAAVYPAPVPSAKTPSAETPSISTATENMGRFIHSQCDQELFNTEYLRSNKASGHKNLRCFPHCCGGHNPKSFCGSGLIVECALPHAQLALGRFEEVVKTPLALSSRAADALASNAELDANTTTTNKSTTTKTDATATSNKTSNQDANESESAEAKAADHDDDRILLRHSYSRRELLRELKSSENPFGKWFKGVAVLNSQAASQAPSPRFHVNGNRQSWHYGWQSSRLNCKNLHVFKVYFFNADSSNGSSDLVECVATVSSPPFRISSSRKARKTFKSSPSLHSLGSVSDDQLSIPQSSPRLLTTTEDDDRLSVDSYESGEGVGLPSRPTATTPMTLASLHHRSHHNGFATNPGSAARRAFDFNHLQGASARAAGDLLPSLQSRISRASTITAEAAFAQHQQSQYRERKRLIRSASLQSDYFSSMASFSAASQSLLLTPTREPRAQTFLGEEPTPSPQVGSSRSRMLRMDSLLNAQDGAAADHHEDSVRPSLPAISAPANHSFHSSHSQLGPVITPVADMMQLHLETPRVVTRTPSASSITSSVAWPTTEMSNAAPVRATPKARRKRNRSTDSMGRSLPDNQADADAAGAWYEGPLLDEVAPGGDWDLVAQAHALGVAVAIVTRLKQVGDLRGGAPASYEILWRSTRQQGLGPSVATISSETKPALAKMCTVLADVASKLVHESSFLADVRTKLHEFVRVSYRNTGQDKSANVGRCYEALLEFVMARVETEITRAMASHNVPSSGDSSPSPLVDLLRSAEHELVDELWWRDVTLFDDSDDEYPFAEFVESYIDAVKTSQQYQELDISRIAGTSRGDLTGAWRLASITAEDSRGHPNATAQWMPTTWLHQQLEYYQSQVYRIVETATSVTLTLGNSLVSPSCPFVAELDHGVPLTSIPVDHFPYAFTRRQLLLAYRAWRDTTNGSIGVQAMQWPTEADLRAADDRTATYRLLRKRMTSYFSVLSSSRIQVRFVVEGSVTEDAKLCAMAVASPCDDDMVEYFKAPASWEVLAQSALEFERVL